MLTDPLFWLVAIPAVLITGISKSGFADGVGGLTAGFTSFVAHAGGRHSTLTCYR